MIYFLYGSNSVEVSRKVLEIKKAFFKKNPNFLFDELDAHEEGVSHADFLGLIENPSLFSQKRLLILKNLLSGLPNTEKIFLQNLDFFKNSQDVFVFWESNLEKKEELFETIKKSSIKTQELTEKKESSFVSKDTSVFRIVDRLFAMRGCASLLGLKEASDRNIDSKSLVNIIFWKLKKSPKKTKWVCDLGYQTILTDLNLKIDSKNEKEHLSRLAIGVASRV